MTAPFDSVVVVDWSAAASPSAARPSKDAIWLGVCSAQGETTSYHRTRAGAETALTALLAAEVIAGRRVLAGFDFPMGYPAGFAARLTGQATAQSVWGWMEAHVTDGPDNRNSRFALAQDINRRFAAAGPFWGRPAGLDLPDLPDRKPVTYHLLGLPERRRVESVVPRAQPVWKLYTTGSVGSQSLMGLPMIARLARHAAVWPFTQADAALVLAEVYPSLINAAVRAQVGIKDAAQVRFLARSLWRLSQDRALDAVLADVPDWPDKAEEGWILGAGHQAALLGALS